MGYSGSPPADRQTREGLDRVQRDVDRLREEDIDVSYPQRLFMRTADGARYRLDVEAGPFFSLIDDAGAATLIGPGGGSSIDLDGGDATSAFTGGIDLDGGGAT